MNAYILAGGKSSRMGEDKGLVLFHNKPMISYVIEVVTTITPNIFIVSSNEDYEVFSYPLIADNTANLGPAGAIDTLLHHSHEQYNIVLPCDMPFIDIASVQYLIDNIGSNEICVPKFQHHVEALIGIYQKKCEKKWHELVTQGILKLSDLLSHFTTTFVDGDGMAEKNERLFVNVNSKETLLKY